MCGLEADTQSVEYKSGSTDPATGIRDTAGMRSFSIGSERSAHFLASTRCGCTGLRPTSDGAAYRPMALSWSMDKLAPSAALWRIAHYLSAIHGPDARIGQWRRPRSIGRDPKLERYARRLLKADFERKPMSKKAEEIAATPKSRRSARNREDGGRARRARADTIGKYNERPYEMREMDVKLVPWRCEFSVRSSSRC